MDQRIKDVKLLDTGYRVGQKSIGIVCYADDALLMAEDEDLQPLLYRLTNEAESLNMQISVEKKKRNQR